MKTYVLLFSLLFPGLAAQAQIVVKTYYPTGELQYEFPTIDGNNHGLVKEYYKNGQVKTTIPYVEGRMHGNAKGYDQHGRLRAETVYVNNKAESGKRYDENGAQIDYALKVKKVIAAELGIALEKVANDSSFVSLGADELAIIELIMEISQEFNLTIPDNDAELITRVSEAIRYVEANVGW